MKLETLTKGLAIRLLDVDVDVEISGVQHDSRVVEPGDLFVALAGQRHDGRIFVPQAVARGAVAVLSATPAPRDSAVPWLVADRPRAVLGPLAARLYDHPDRQLLMVGVTGTNGKSTVVALASSVLEAAGRRTGRIGTLGYEFGASSEAAERTTPEAPILYRFLRRMREAGSEAVAMEVSSHALALGRVGGMSFDIALFTNLSRDHFDFHRDFDDYYAAKRVLFDQLKPGGRSVINVDDAYGRRLCGEVEGALTFGAGGDVSILERSMTSDGTVARFATPRGALEVKSQLVGEFNLDNVLAAVALGEALELSPDAIREGIGRCAPLAGRMERVAAPFPVFIDYAHTDAALEAALRALRGVESRKLLVVFGCGGDRDPGKRALMGRVAGELADLSILTSDNPRQEDPLTILGAVEQGIKQSGDAKYRVIPDRREAIRMALQIADSDWVVLVAGKGHETVQIIGDEEVPFSDREVIERCLEGELGLRSSG